MAHSAPTGTPPRAPAPASPFNLLNVQHLLHGTAFGKVHGVAISREQYHQISEHLQDVENSACSLERLAAGLEMLTVLLTENTQMLGRWESQALNGLLTPTAEKLRSHAATLFAATLAQE